MRADPVPSTPRRARETRPARLGEIPLAQARSPQGRSPCDGGVRAGASRSHTSHTMCSPSREHTCHFLLMTEHHSAGRVCEDVPDRGKSPWHHVTPPVNGVSAEHRPPHRQEAPAGGTTGGRARVSGTGVGHGCRVQVSARRTSQDMATDALGVRWAAPPGRPPDARAAPRRRRWETAPGAGRRREDSGRRGEVGAPSGRRRRPHTVGLLPGRGAPGPRGGHRRGRVSWCGEQRDGQRARRRHRHRRCRRDARSAGRRGRTPPRATPCPERCRTRPARPARAR